MATVIDSLLVTLGLDAKGYLAGAAAARTERKKLSVEEAAAAKDAETFAKRRTEAYTTLRGEIRRVAAEAASLFAVFTAGKGLSQFIAEITTGDAATGRLAKNLGMATGDLAAWERAVERAGGSAAGFDATISSLSREVQNYQLTGQSGGMLNYFRALGVQLTGTSDDLLKISGVVSGMNRQQATALMSGAGIDQGTQNLLLEGTAKVRAALEEAKKLGVPSDKDAKNAQDLLANIMKVRQAVEDTVRVILNQFGPSINQALAEFTVWITVNGPRLKTEIADRITWIVSEVRSFITSANEAAAAVGGWVHISEALFALWAVSKVAGLIKAVATVGGVFAGGAGAAASGVSALARVAGPVGIAAAVMAPSSANAGEDERLKKERDERAKNPAAYDSKMRAGQLAMIEAGGSRREQDSFIDRLAKTLVQFMQHPAAHLDTGSGPEGMTPSEAIRAGKPQSSPATQITPGSRALPSGAGNTQAFIERYGPMAQRAAEQTGISARSILGQIMQETGGRGDRGNNPFNIQAGQGYTGQTITRGDTRADGTPYQTRFRAYTDLNHAGDDYAALLRRRYPEALNTGDDTAAFARGLKRGGYAEDPNYVANVVAATRRLGLPSGSPSDNPRGGSRSLPPGSIPPVPTPQQVSQLRYGNSSASSTSNDNSSSTHVGSVTIQTAATDARGIAGSFKEAMTGMGLAAQANTGLS